MTTKSVRWAALGRTLILFSERVLMLVGFFYHASGEATRIVELVRSTIRAM